MVSSCSLSRFSLQFFISTMSYAYINLCKGVCVRECARGSFFAMLLLLCLYRRLMECIALNYYQICTSAYDIVLAADGVANLAANGNFIFLGCLVWLAENVPLPLASTSIYSCFIPLTLTYHSPFPVALHKPEVQIHSLSLIFSHIVNFRIRLMKNYFIGWGIDIKR